MKPLLAAVLCALPALPLAALDEETEQARISIDLKDASIADVVRVLAEVGSFQVVLDPGASCTLTLKLKEVRCPTVLEVALRSCGLGREEDGGVVRIAPLARLTEQAAARRRLEEERERGAAQTVTRHRLSYARAQELAPIVKKLLSPPGRGPLRRPHEHPDHHRLADDAPALRR